ncbi:hypothetical protein D5086_020170 [Populus alba]|uniref:Uncharacterized protein n=1 Tax=Populus alba TaxID=43335 RepID=A0ACC4BJX4_POPAL
MLLNPTSDKGLLDLNEIEKVLTDPRADDVKAKQKQKGARRMTLPGVEGQEGGKWILINSGKVIVHVLDEEARADYDLESLWTSETSKEDPVRIYSKLKQLLIVISFRHERILVKSSTYMEFEANQ